MKREKLGECPYCSERAVYPLGGSYVCFNCDAEWDSDLAVAVRDLRDQMSDLLEPVARRLTRLLTRRQENP